MIDHDTYVHSSISQMIDRHGKCGIRMGRLILRHSMNVLHEDLLTISLFLDRCVAFLILILKRLPVIGRAADDLSAQ